jgi:K+-transporting ATPase ATPase A chain
MNLINTDIWGVIAMFLMAIIIAIPLGKYIANVFSDKPGFSDRIFGSLERVILKLTGVDAKREMSWKEHLIALLTINLVWFVVGMLILMFQANLPLNPDGNPNMSPDLAFNTVISFLVNCNLQHYSGETGVSYFSQTGLMFLQFVSSGVGIAAAVVLFKALKDKGSKTLGNFYDIFLKSCTRILLPISFIVALILVFQGTPMTYEGKDSMINLQGDTVEVSRGPVAAFVAIKHVGTNGGGFYGANSNHPLENPTYLTNIVEMLAQFIIPVAMVFALGFFIKKKKLSWMIFGVMTIGFLCLAVPNVLMESQGSPAIERLGINQDLGSMEGKEIRVGSAASGFWSIVTTVISTGSINSMHDSSMPLSGMNQMLAMMIMVGRTPEFMGKKVEAREMKIAMMVALIHPFLILVGTAIAAAYPSIGASTTNDPGFHGFSEMLYEFTSASANNGSGFEGLGDNTLWWNISTGIVLLFGRFIPIIGPVAIAGLLSEKRYIPEGAGTLKTDTGSFGFMVLAVIVIVAALAFFPALTLGPIAEYFILK